MNNKLTRYSKNMRTTVTEDGFTILYSYDTPVCGRDEKGLFRSKTYFDGKTSKSTERQINSYFGCDSKSQVGRIVEQSYIEGLVS
jgi:hypothetical protein